MPELQSDGIVEVPESQLSDVQGGMLLPAVQKVREAASRLSAFAADDEPIITGAGPTSGPHVK